MEQQDELFQLIRSLTKSEKKFFTQYVNIYEKGSSPVYLQLFDFLNDEPKYDEERIFKKFRDQNFKKNYAVTKHYLKNLIVKTLRHSEITAREERDLTVYVLDIKRLMAKGLFPMAKKMIEKLKEEAYEDEKFYDILHLISMQRGLITLGYYKYEPEVTLESLDDEEEQVLEMNRQLRQVMNAVIRLYSLMHYEMNNLPQEVLKQIHELGAKKYLQDFDLLASAKAKHSFLQFWALYYCAIGNYDKYAEFAKKKLVYVKSEKLPPSAKLNWLVLAHNHCMAAEMLTKDFSSFEDHFKFLEGLQFQSPMHDAERYQAISIYAVLYYTKNYDEQKLQHYINYARQGLEKFAPFTRKAFIYTLRTSISYANLKMNKLDECWAEINDLLSLTNGETRKDLVGHVKIINLMLRFEMKEYNYVAYLLKNTYRYFMTYMFTTPVHKFLISYLKEALKADTDKDFNDVNKSYHQILQNLRFDPSEADMVLVMIAEDYLEKALNKVPVKAA